MKAKLYILGDQFEIRLSNDELLIPGDRETKKAFVARTKEFVNNELLDDVFELIEIDRVMVATNDDATLLSALESAQGLQKELIETVLADRKTKGAKKEKKEKVGQVATDAAKETPHYKECEANVGKFVQFSPFKSIEVIQGKIVGIALNKTNTIVYYTVLGTDGKRKCCGALNESVKFIQPIEGFVDGKLAKVAKEPKTKKEKAAAKEAEVKKGIIQDTKPVKKAAAKAPATPADEIFGTEANDLM